MNFPDALRKALAIVRGDRRGRRAVYLQSASSRYRILPDDNHVHVHGYVILLSVRYAAAWQPWGEIDHFGVDDILCRQWSLT